MILLLKNKKAAWRLNIMSMLLAFERFSCHFLQTQCIFKLLTGSFVLALYHLNGLWSHSTVNFTIVLILFLSLESWSEAVSSVLALLIVFFFLYPPLYSTCELHKPTKKVSLTLESQLCYWFAKDLKSASHVHLLADSTDEIYWL